MTRSSRRLRWVVAAVVVGVVAVLALSGDDGGQVDMQAGARRKGELVVRAGGGSDVGQKAPSFSVATTTGSTFSLPAGKPAALFFMAGWCGSCLPEAEALAAIDREFGDRVAIVAISADPTDSPDALRRFAGEAAAGYGFVHDKEGALVTAFGVRSLDTTVVVDKAGRIVFRDAVPSDEATLRRSLARAGLA